MRKRIGCEEKGAFLFHFTRGADECSEDGAGQSPTHADPLHSNRSQLFNGEGNALQAHDDIHRPRNGRTNLSDGFQARQAGRIQNICADLGKGLQSLYGVVQMGTTL